MKRKIRLFFKSFYISALILLCLIIGIMGISKTYESIRQIGFGEYKKAVEIDSQGIRILDFEMKF